MAEVADEFTLLCESCGYPLTGLPTDGRCPECGEPITDSLPEARTGSPWQNRPGLLPLLASGLGAIRHPRTCFRRLRIEGERSTSLLLANITAASLLFSAGPALDGLLTGWDLAPFFVVILPIATWTSLLVLTLIECAGVQFFGGRSRWRITPAVAWSVCAHAAAGWVLGAALWCVSYAVFARPLMDRPRWMPAWAEWAAAAAMLGSLLAALLAFETLVYMGIRQCRFANRMPPRPPPSMATDRDSPAGKGTEPRRGDPAT